MAKVGDTVRYLNAVGGGRITRIDGQIAYVDEDGFETPVMLKELVVVGTAPKEKAKGTVASAPPQPRVEVPKMPPAEVEEAFVETAQGERLNVVLAYEATDLKRLSLSNYDAYLVNDSNYWLLFTYLTRGNEQTGWVTRHAGHAEPGMVIYLGEVSRDDLPQMDRVAVQYLAYKTDKPFALKTVACVEQKLDTTKFFKLHCFQPNTYFDEPVIAVPIVRNDLPVRSIEINNRELETAMREKSRADKVVPQPLRKQRAKPDEPLVIDLHITELIDTTTGLSNSDMLNLQIDKFREVMDANLRYHGKKIVFIHGKGEGVLRKALLKELAYRYKGCDVQDASFREYGFGATQVKIK